MPEMLLPKAMSIGLPVTLVFVIETLLTLAGFKV